MTKADLAEKIIVKLGYQRKDAIDLVESVLDILKNTLEAGEDVKISCFGSFHVRNKADRKGRNPVTGETLIISGRKVLTFKPSLLLKEYINL